MWLSASSERCLHLVLSALLQSFCGFVVRAAPSRWVIGRPPALPDRCSRPRQSTYLHRPAYLLRLCGEMRMLSANASAVEQEKSLARGGPVISSFRLRQLKSSNSFGHIL